MNSQRITSPFVWHPKSADEAWELKRTYGSDAVFVGGGTLLRTQWEAGTAVIPPYLINLGSISGSANIEVRDHEVSIGAMTSLSECRSSKILQSRYPLLIKVLRNVAAPSIRNVATLGGNITSMVGDTLPVLLAYDAVLHWHDGEEERLETLELWLLSLLTGTVSHQSARANRLLLRIELPIQVDEDKKTVESPMNKTIKRFSAFHKVGRREIFTPSVVTAALTGLMDSAGRLSDARIAVAGGQTTASRLSVLEQALNGRQLDSDVIAEAYHLVLQQYEPRGDVFASVDYRKHTAANLIASELWTLSNTLAKREGGDRYAAQ